MYLIETRVIRTEEEFKELFQWIEDNSEINVKHIEKIFKKPFWDVYKLYIYDISVGVRYNAIFDTEQDAILFKLIWV